MLFCLCLGNRQIEIRGEEEILKWKDGGRLSERRVRPLSTALHTRPAANSGDVISAVASAARGSWAGPTVPMLGTGRPVPIHPTPRLPTTARSLARNGSKTCASPGIGMRSRSTSPGSTFGGLARSWSPCVVSGRHHDVLCDGACSVSPSGAAGVQLRDGQPGSGFRVCELTESFGDPSGSKMSPHPFWRFKRDQSELKTVCNAFLQVRLSQLTSKPNNGREVRNT